MAPPKKPLRAPILAKALEARVLTSIDGAELDQCCLEACTLSDQVGENVRFDGVKIVGGTLSGTKVTHVSWLDVLCERSDLSMFEWSSTSLMRVEIRGCRMTGAKLIEAELDNVRFVECQLDYVSFRPPNFGKFRSRGAPSKRQISAVQSSPAPHFYDAI